MAKANTSWSKVSEYLKLALGFVVPQDSTETAFFFLKLSEIVDVASQKASEVTKPE